MRIGVQTGGVIDHKNIEEGFRKLQAAGFDCVDFNIDHFLSTQDAVQNSPDPIYTKSETEIKVFFDRYHKAAAKYGIAFGQLHAPFPSYVKANEPANEYLIRALEKCLFVSACLDCRHVIVHPFFLGYAEKLSAEEEWELNIRSYSRLIPAAKQYGVTICLENMFTGHNGKIYAACCSDFQMAAHIIDKLNHIAGKKCFAFCLDTGHAILTGQELESAMLTLGNRLEALHIHDNNGISDQHLFPYMGVGDWKRFTGGLRKIQYRGDLSFETFNAMNVIAPALHEKALAFLAEIGRFFAGEIMK